MKRIIFIAILSLLVPVILMAQDQTTAIRYSQNFPLGTARFMAMGGAFNAIGGDLSAASQNPAGLGFYRGSEFTITPVYSYASSSAAYLGNRSSDQTDNLSIGNLGLVSSYTNDRTDGLAGVTFAFGYNALQNFHNNTLLHGVNNGTSLLDNFAYYANNSNQLDDFYENLAHQTALMPLDTNTNTYWHYLEPFAAIGYDGYGQEQVRVVERRGYIGEYVFSAAFNISHKFYLGGTFGLHSVRFNEDIYHEEEDINDLEPDFDAFRFGEYNSTRGYGYVFKMGLIYKPIHALRLGASFHAPVVYKLTDEKFTDLNTYWDANSSLSDDYASSGLFSKDYTLRTPFRLSAGAAFLFGKFGIISAEYEYMDYSMSDLDSPGYKFFDENISISNDFGVVHNVKTGLELRLNPVYLRGGAAWYMNPYTDSRNGSDRWIYSAGIGFRANQTYVDVAATLGTNSELYGLYQYNPEIEEGFEKASVDVKTARLAVTVGYKF